MLKIIKNRRWILIISFIPVLLTMILVYPTYIPSWRDTESRIFIGLYLVSVIVFLLYLLVFCLKLIQVRKSANWVYWIKSISWLFATVSVYCVCVVINLLMVMPFFTSYTVSFDQEFQLKNTTFYTHNNTFIYDLEECGAINSEVFKKNKILPIMHFNQKIQGAVISIGEIDNKIVLSYRDHNCLDKELIL